jgi:hypothetical protein
MSKFDAADKIYLENRKKVADKIGKPDLFEIVDQFGLYSGAHTIGRSLFVYDILKQTLDVPGNIVEFGSWKGSNLLFMAKVLNLLQPNSIKQIYSFDSFEGLQTFSDKDGDIANVFTSSYKGNEAILREFLSLYDMNSWVHLVIGDAMKTIDAFQKKNEHMMISMAYIDFDLYDPCKKALEFTDERLSVGGIIAMDEALMEEWPGEGIALREFLRDRKGCYQMFSNPITRQPTVYLKKIK